MVQTKLETSYLDDDIYLEFGNEEHIKLVTFEIKKALMLGELKYKTNIENVSKWFLKKYIKVDLEITRTDLIDICEKCRIELI